MGAIIKACNVNNAPKNTGKECDTAMVATAMLIAIKSDETFDDTDLLDPVSWLDDLIHQRKAFPLFGQKAPIREINNNAETDIIVTLDDGLQVFMRYGVYNRQFGTTSGGLCYAQALQSFLNSGYSIIEVDAVGQMLARKNTDGTYSGIITDFMYAPMPMLADLKSTPYKNFFKYSFSPTELINNGIIFTGAQALLSMTGLIDAKITKNAAGSVTELTIGILTECAGADLVAKFGADWEDPTNFIVTDKADGSVKTVTGVTTVAGDLVLAGTWTTAHTYIVIGAAPSVWQTNSIEGYDGSTPDSSVEILIP
jgi:hypothetical protein